MLEFEGLRSCGLWVEWRVLSTVGNKKESGGWRGSDLSTGAPVAQEGTVKQTRGNIEINENR